MEPRAVLPQRPPLSGEPDRSKHAWDVATTIHPLHVQQSQLPQHAPAGEAAAMSMYGSFRSSSLRNTRGVRHRAPHGNNGTPRRDGRGDNVRVVPIATAARQPLDVP